MITSIEAWQVEIPLKIGFKHAQMEHKFHRCVYVRINSQQKSVFGLGECIPRTYLTGENINDVMAWLDSRVARWFEADFQNPKIIQELLFNQFCEASREQRLASSSGFDIAVYDLWSRISKTPIVELLELSGIPRLQNPSLVEVPTNAPIGLGAWQKTQVLGFIGLGFRRFKIKIAHREEWEKIRFLVDFLSHKGCEIILDCNGAFSWGEAHDFMQQAFQYGVRAIEEPIKRRENSYVQLKSLSDEWGRKLAIIVDEHFCTLEDGEFWKDSSVIRNLRLAKNGGLTGGLWHLKVINDTQQEAKKMGQENHFGVPRSRGLQKTMIGHLVGEGLLMEKAASILRFFHEPVYVDPAWGSLLLAAHPHELGSSSLQNPKGLSLGILNKISPSWPLVQGSHQDLGLGVCFHEKIVQKFCHQYKIWSRQPKQVPLASRD